MANITNLQLLLSRYQQIPTSTEDPSYRQARSLFLESVGFEYKTFTRNDPILLSDYYLHAAEEVFNRNTFQNHPGSWQRLDPLARTYIENFGALLQTIRDDKLDILSARIQIFSRSHVHFLNQFIKEFQEVGKHTKVVVKHSHPNSIEAFYNAAQSLKSEAFMQEVSERDPSLFTSIPFQALVRILTAQEELVPELFLGENLMEQKRLFAELSEEEKISVQKAQPKTEAALSLYKQMSQTVSNAQREKSSPYFNPIMNIVFEKLES